MCVGSTELQADREPGPEVGHWPETDHVPAHLRDWSRRGQGLRVQVGAGPGDRPDGVPGAVSAVTAPSFLAYGPPFSRL